MTTVTALPNEPTPDYGDISDRGAASLLLLMEDPRGLESAHETVPGAALRAELTALFEALAVAERAGIEVPLAASWRAVEAGVEYVVQLRQQLGGLPSAPSVSIGNGTKIALLALCDWCDQAMRSDVRMLGQVEHLCATLREIRRTTESVSNDAGWRGITAHWPGIVEALRTCPKWPKATAADEFRLQPATEQRELGAGSAPVLETGQRTSARAPALGQQADREIEKVIGSRQSPGEAGPSRKARGGATVRRVLPAPVRRAAEVLLACAEGVALNAKELGSKIGKKSDYVRHHVVFHLQPWLERVPADGYQVPIEKRAALRAWLESQPVRKHHAQATATPQRQHNETTPTV
jgi:hypothetical protein